MPGDVIEPLGSFSPVKGSRGRSTSTALQTSSNISAMRSLRELYLISHFLHVRQRQTMVDGIRIVTDSGSCHEPQCKVISEADSIVEHIEV